MRSRRGQCHWWQSCWAAHGAMPPRGRPCAIGRTGGSRQSLARTLGERRACPGRFDRLLDDLASGSGAFAGGTEAAAQDWLFARVRLAARKAERRRPPGTEALRGARAGPPEAEDVPPAPAQRDRVDPAASRSAAHRASALHGRRRFARPRQRAPAAAECRGPVAHDHRRAGAGRRCGCRGRGWLRTLLLLVLALLLGGRTRRFWRCLALARAAGRGGRAAAAGRRRRFRRHRTDPADARAPPPIQRQRPRPGRAADRGAGAAGDRRARGPCPGCSAPWLEPRGPDAGTRERRGSSPRIVVHHGGGPESGDRGGTARLRNRCGAGFGQVEVRAVTFDVATASVRYFHDEDRAAAETAGQRDRAVP